MMKKNEGSIVPVKSARNNVTTDNHVPCRLCHGYYAKSELWRHTRSRKQHNQHESALLTRNAVVSGKLGK